MVLHDEHDGSDGFGVPSATHAPPIEHQPGSMRHDPAPSQVSQPPAAHEYALPPQEPAVQVSPTVHALPSSHGLSLIGVQAVGVSSSQTDDDGQ